MEYIKALEEEKKKILVFERELPLSLQLITQAIEAYKKQLNIEGSENVTAEVPVLEEFIPLKPSYSSSDEEIISKNKVKINDGGDKIPDWLRSSQLWNEQPVVVADSVKKPIAVNANKTGGAFHPFKKEKAASAIQTSSTSNDNSNGQGQSSGSHIEEKVKEKKDGSSHRKERRCWSPELHKRFLNALQDLGGSQVATPKQIRELMKVDGLTNDEVKSHLQKYRLHNRKPTNSTVEANLSEGPHQPHILLLGGIFVPPSNYTGSTTATNADTKIYAPVASLPSQVKQQQQNINKYNTSPTSPLVSTVLFQNRDSNSDHGCKATNSASSGTSSSTSTA